MVILETPKGSPIFHIYSSLFHCGVTVQFSLGMDQSHQLINSPFFVLV